MCQYDFPRLHVCWLCTSVAAGWNDNVPPEPSSWNAFRKIVLVSKVTNLCPACARFVNSTFGKIRMPVQVVHQLAWTGVWVRYICWILRNAWIGRALITSKRCYHYPGLWLANFWNKYSTSDAKQYMQKEPNFHFNLYALLKVPDSPPSPSFQLSPTQK